jgi:hypothetical protein
MKYNDRTTKALNQPWSYKWEQREIPNSGELYRRKCIKELTRKVLVCGIDPDWWSLISKDRKYQIHQNYSMLRAFSKKEGVLLPSIREYIDENKKDYWVDQSKLRDIKLNRLLK